MAAVSTQPSSGAAKGAGAEGKVAPTYSGRVAPKPDVDKHNARVKELNAQIDSTKAQLNKLRDRLQGLSSTSKPSNGSGAVNGTGSSSPTSGSDRHSDLRSKLSSAKRAQDESRKQREDVLRKLQQLHDQIKDRTAEVKALRDRMPVKSAKAAAERIRQLEAKIAAGTMKLLEERKAGDEIAQLKAKLPLFDTLDAKEAETETDQETVRDLEAKLQDMQPSESSAVSAYDQVKKELDVIAAEKQATHEKIQQLQSERTSVNDKLDALYDERTRIKQEFRTAMDLHMTTRNEDRERKAKQYREQRRAQELARLRELADEEREFAEVPAYAEEITICKNLIAYLAQYADVKCRVPDSGSATAAAPARAHNLRKVDAEIKGATLLKRGEEDYFAGAAKSKKGGKKKNKNKGQNATAVSAPSADQAEPAAPAPASGGLLKLPLTVMEHFLKVQVDVPASTGDAKGAVEKLQERIAWYQKHQEEATTKQKADVEAKIRKMLEGAGASAEDLEQVCCAAPVSEE